MRIWIAMIAMVVAMGVQASFPWSEGTSGGKAPPPPALEGSNWLVTQDGGIWVWPNNNKGRGGTPVYAGTFSTSYYPRSSPMFSGWIAAMHAISGSRQPVAPSGGGYTGGSRFNWNTGNPGGPVGADPFPGLGIPTGGGYLWPD